MITFPKTIDQASAAKGTVRAGGTDLSERRAHGSNTGDLIDLRDLEGLDQIEPMPDGGLKVGARVRIADLADAPLVQQAWPGLAQAAGGLATPQIRNRATLGGNLLQKVRCWYFRNPHFTCHMKGGSVCPARTGDHLYAVAIDLGPCISPHPSSMAMALMAFDATVLINGEQEMSVEELVGDGSDPTREHILNEGQILTHVRVPAAKDGDRSAYTRTIHRSRSEWPLVEVLARLQHDGSVVTDAQIAVGGIANIPLRLVEVEDALRGKPLSEIPAACAVAGQGLNALPMTAYKLTMLPRTIEDVLSAAAQLAAATPLATTEDVEATEEVE